MPGQSSLNFRSLMVLISDRKSGVVCTTATTRLPRTNQICRRLNLVLENGNFERASKFRVGIDGSRQTYCGSVAEGVLVKVMIPPIRYKQCFR